MNSLVALILVGLCLAAHGLSLNQNHHHHSKVHQHPEQLDDETTTTSLAADTTAAADTTQAPETTQAAVSTEEPGTDEPTDEPEKIPEEDGQGDDAADDDDDDDDDEDSGKDKPKKPKKPKVEEGTKVEEGEPDNSKPNMTPFVHQLGNMWEGVVPNYEKQPGDEGPDQYKNLFASEGEAKAWVYSKTGAEEPLMYETPAGADDAQESIIEQVVKEGESAGNSNYENENDQTTLEKPIIDEELAHTEHQSYHDTYDHMSTIKGSGREHGETHQTKAAKRAAWKAKRASEWSKSVSGRNHKNGGNNQLTKKSAAKTQGAGDAANKKSQHLMKVGRR